MRKAGPVLLGFLLVAAACSESPAGNASLPDEVPPISEVASTTSSTLPASPDVAVAQPTPVANIDVAPSTTSSERVRPDGPDAPDFELALGQGGTFSLSAEEKPVYMVFWAEW